MAGLHFYRNLFETIDFFGTKYPPILSQDKDGRWDFSKAKVNQKDLYKRIVSNHLNEALNPSQIELLQRPIVRRAVKARCAAWIKRYPKRTRATYDRILKEVSTWNGIEYGHRHSRLIKIGHSCYKEKK